tara:strand:+ start:1311 stop:1862 length:552 start_codon:yes stop_codon:yes gene_type:complete
MKIILFFFTIFFFIQTTLKASNKENIVKKLSTINNLSFNFIQTIGEKDEEGECVIKYPKKIFCKYKKRNNKIIVSNGNSLVIKSKKQYYRYPIKTTPFEYLLDKKFLIEKINSSELNEIENKYLFIQIVENNNNINVFFNKKNFTLVGWQVEDVYQNLSVTYIFDTSINKNIDEKIFRLPLND